MAPLALPLVAPLVAASAAYLDGRFSISSDLWMITNIIKYGRTLVQIEKEDKVNIFYLFENLAKDPKTADRTFLAVPPGQEQSGQSEWTYGAVYDLVLKYARWLKDEQGVQKGEVVAMDVKNKPQFVFIWLALWSLGARPAFINTNLRDNSFTHCVKISSSRLLLLDSELEDVLTEQVRAEFAPAENGRAVEIIMLETALEEYIAGLTPFRAPDQMRSGVTMKDPAILIYTSGTTGLPKAANVSWAKPRSGATFWCKIIELTQDDRYFTAMPLYHSSASILCVCQAFGTACTIIISSKFSPRTFMKQIADTRATAIQYIGEMCRYLLSSPSTPYDRAHALRLAFGNGMRQDVWQPFKDRFNIPAICEFYAATESPMATFVFSRNDFYRGAVGRGGLLIRTLFAGNTVLVKHDHATDEPWRDPQTGLCVKVATGETGELLAWLDPANIQDKFQGYLGNAKASSSKILRDVFKSGDAYFRTGDLQRRDADGKWWFVDRIGDTFRWKGENVSTAEVAESLGAHPALREINVYGVQIPQHDGRAGCAAIGLADGAAMNDALAAALAAHARERLPRYAVPLFLRIRRDFDITGTWKHQKVGLRNEGVDPAKTGEDEIYWLPPGEDRYRKFGKAEWERVAGGGAKL